MEREVTMTEKKPVKKHDKPHETNSSGPHTDKLNSDQDRFEADPALEPELARENEDKLAKGYKKR
jgi:hypothetical protein